METLANSKACIKCLIEYPITDEFFHRNSISPDGFRHHCRSCKTKYDQERYQANRDAIIDKSKAHYWANPQKKSEYDRDYRLQNQEKIRSDKKQWFQSWKTDYPFDAIAKRMNDRNRQFAPDKRYRFTATDISKLLARHNYKCFYCPERFSNITELEMEHVMPRSRGGKNSISNIVPSCYDCNRQKSYRTVMEYRLNKIVRMTDFVSHPIYREKAA
jgi:5-methylcytosine-specific restriction endonuclease McrA